MRPLVPRSYLLPFLLLSTPFALWGLANHLTDVLLAAFRRIMSLTDYQTSWIQVARFGAYCALALPGAIFIRRFTDKAGVLLRRRRRWPRVPEGGASAHRPFVERRP